jgi:hypothetical protein
MGFADFNVSDLVWTQKPDIWSGSDIAERGYCKDCGSSMSMTYLFDKATVAVTLGSVVEAQPAIPRPQKHIFLASKAPWFVMSDDGAAREDTFDDDFRTRLDKWREEKEKSAVVLSKL